MATQMNRRTFLIGAPVDIAPASVRPPGAKDSGFEAECRDCVACHNECPEGIIAVDGDGRPWVDFARGACTFCGACVAACPTDALDISRVADWPWRAAIDETCMSRSGISCRVCQDTCPESAIAFRLQTGGRAEPRIEVDQCTGCGACVPVCPSKAIALGRQEHLVAETAA